ncbi:3-deoxy-D-manno-octulosonic acid transferase [compost metagenome]
MLREAGALQQVDDADGLAEAVRRLVELPQDAQRMGDAGRAVMRANQGALQRLLDGLGKLIS